MLGKRRRGRQEAEAGVGQGGGERLDLVPGLVND